MITHYDIKMEMQKLKEVLSVEGVNIPSLLQVIKPGTYVFLWVLLWPTFLRLVSVKSDVRDVGFDICAYFHERRSLNNFHRDRVITFEQIAE